MSDFLYFQLSLNFGISSKQGMVYDLKWLYITSTHRFFLTFNNTSWIPETLVEYRATMLEYEKQRMKNIDENNKRMKAMGINKMASPLMGTIPISQKKKRKGKHNKAILEDEEYVPVAIDEESNFSSGSDNEDEFCASQKKSKMTSRCARGGRQGRRIRENGRGADSILSLPSREHDPTNIVVNEEQSQGLHREIVNDVVNETEEEIGLTRTKRGITCGKGARNAMKASKTKLSVEINFQAMRVICTNDSSFMHECGYVLRNNCSLQYKEWRLVPNEVRLPLRHKLTTLFDIDVENANVCKVIDSYMARAWRGYRNQLHSHFKEIRGSEDVTKAKTTPPPNVSKEDWEYLCDMWCDKKYLEIANKKVLARGKRKLNSRNGSKSTIRYHIERGLDLDSSSGQLETWRLTHWDAEKGWISPNAAAIYEDMMKLREEHSVESMSDKSIIENVLGRSSVRLHGWGRDPVVGSNTIGTTSKSKHLTYDELVDALEIVKGKCATMEKTLIEHNIMPPPLHTSGTSEGDATESGENVYV